MSTSNMFNTASRPLSTGSVVSSVLALLVVSVVALLILRHYLPLRSTPGFYLVPVFFAIWLPSVIVLLVPIDLASSAGTDDADVLRGIWLPQRVLLVLWRITYWLIFALTWFILPILGEYSDAGYREPRDKLMYSLRSNAQYHATVLGSALAALVYVVVRYDVSFDSLKGVVMALAYCWGLVLAICLMGHGLVSIPRGLIRNANVAGRLRRLECRAPRARERMEDAAASLEEMEGQVSELAKRKAAGGGSAAGFRDWIEELEEIACVHESYSLASPLDARTVDRTVPNVVTPKYLADLTRRLIRAKHARSRYANEWYDLLTEASTAQTILNSAATKKLSFDDAPSPRATTWNKKPSIRLLSPYTRYLWHYQVAPRLQTGLGVALALASTCIIWSEVVRFPLPQLSVVRLTVVRGRRASDGAVEINLAGQTMAALWICYMCAAALAAVTAVRTWRGRALVRRNTAHESALWYAMQVAKLTVPLAYNFLTLLSQGGVYKRTAFYGFLGRLIDYTGPGRWFDHVFPVFLVVPALAALLGLYGRARRLLAGVDLALDDDDDEDHVSGSSSWREGRELVARELDGDSTRRRDELYARLAAAASNRGGGVSPVAVSMSRDSGVRRGRYRDEPPTEQDGEGREEEEGLLRIIGHRVKNTVDGMEAPRWLRDLGRGLGTPRWMTTAGGQDGAGGGQRQGDGLRSWFGGDGGNGQIRL